METENLISIQTISTHYNVELSFISSLSDFGLIEIVRLQETDFVDKEQLGEIEKMMRLHYDLEINLAGIDAISHLLLRIKNMQNELNLLKNKIHNSH
jgi:hypothetical protein